MAVTDKTREEQKPRVAFVAGGGAVKAYAYHLGVLEGLQEDGYFFRSGAKWEPRTAPPGQKEISTYVGSSAGACVVAALAAGHPLSEMEAAIMGTAKSVPTFGYRTMFVPVAPNPVKYVRRLARRWRLGGLRPAHALDVGGFITAAGVERYFRKHVLPTNRFQDLHPDLYLTATQVNNLRKVIFGHDDSLEADGYDADRAYYNNVPISRALAAAISIPPLFSPYSIENPSSGKPFHYYDGEVREPLSAHIARDAGADFIIASSIWNPYTYDDEVGSLADMGMSVVGQQALHQSIEQKLNLERGQSRLYDQLLAAIEDRDIRHRISDQDTAAFKDQVCGILRHRPARLLYVVPEPSDHRFFFSSHFRFSSKLLAGFIAAGRRAYRFSVQGNPEFREALEERLASEAT